MNERHVRAVLKREWRELRRNKLTLLTVALVPAALVAVGLIGSGTISALGADATDDDLRELPEGMARLANAIGSKNAMHVLLNEQLLTMLLMVSAVLPATIAAHAIIGEKVERTLEPVLATPVSTGDLLLGKTLAAVLPAWVVSFGSYLVFMGGVVSLSPPQVFLMAIRPVWWLAFAAVAPLISAASALSTLTLSSRVNDPRTAQGLAGALVVPLLGVGMSALFGVLSIELSTIAIGALVMALLDALLLVIATRVFARETILTRWR